MQPQEILPSSGRFGKPGTFHQSDLLGVLKLNPFPPQKKNTLHIFVDFCWAASRRLFNKDMENTNHLGVDKI